VDDLASRLPHLAEGSCLSSGRRSPELFLKFAPCHIDAHLILGELTFRYRPNALVAFLPEGTAGMNQQQLELAVPLPVEKQTGALDTQCPTPSPNVFSPARIGTLSQFSGGGSGQLQDGS